MAQELDERKATEIISEEERTRIVDIVTVLQTFKAFHFADPAYHSDPTYTIDSLMARIGQGQEKDFPKDSPRAQIALLFLNEFNKLEKNKGKTSVKSVANFLLTSVGFPHLVTLKAFQTNTQ